MEKEPPAYNPGVDDPYRAGYDQGYPMQAASPPPVVMSQPQAGQHTTNTTVVIQQPDRNERPALRDWNTGLCSCCEDMSICLCGTFCSLCLMCEVSSDMGESRCVPCCVPTALMALRIKWRTQHNILGDIMGDHTTTCCCGCCALCQLAREVKTHKIIQNARI